MSNKKETSSSREELEKIAHQNFHRKFLDSLSLATIKTNEIFDRFCKWLLLGTGATATLIIVNIHNVIQHVDKFGLQIAILLLIVSALMGFLSQYFNVIILVMVKIAECSTETLVAQYKEYQQQMAKFAAVETLADYERNFSPDFGKIMDDYINLFPSAFLKSRLRKVMESAEKNKNGGNPMVVGTVVYQFCTVLLQALFYLLFLATISVSITV